MGIHFLFGIGIFSLFVLVILSFMKIRSTGQEFEFVYSWAFWLGAFVWEDLFVFGLYHSLSLSMTWLFQDVRIFLVMTAVFWLVRSAGEVLYFFLQQFHEPTKSPHDVVTHFSFLLQVFGNISPQKGYILLQVLHQSIVMIALSSLVYIVLHWHVLLAWF